MHLSLSSRLFLRPDLKSSKTSAIQEKDQVGHWYEAQLLHYGLPPSKDKARAKMRLLEALNNGTLAIPASIAKLEESLKKEYLAADRKAKAQFKAQQGAGVKKEVGTSKKRKEPGPATINVNVNVGHLGTAPLGQFTTTEVAQPSETPPMKKSRNMATKAGSGKATGKPTAKKSGNQDSPIKVTTSRIGGGLLRENEKTPKKQTAVKRQPTTKKDAPIKKEGAPKKELAVKKEPAIKRESAIKKEPGFKQEPGSKKPSVSSKNSKAMSDPDVNQSASLGLINGYYDISCPLLESEFGDDDRSLILCLDSPRIWGAYDFGQFTGIFLLPTRPYQPSPIPLRCNWRGVETGEGEMSFGNNCVGEIAFHGDGQISGMLNLYGQCEFNGTRRPGPMTAPRPAGMKMEWDGYNEEEYAAANRRRWGGW